MIGIGWRNFEVGWLNSKVLQENWLNSLVAAWGSVGNQCCRELHLSLFRTLGSLHDNAYPVQFEQSGDAFFDSIHCRNIINQCSYNSLIFFWGTSVPCRKNIHFWLSKLKHSSDLSIMKYFFCVIVKKFLDKCRLFCPTLPNIYFA